MNSGEFGFIQELAAFAGEQKESLGLQDDGAIISCGKQKLVIVKDMVQAGVHGLSTDTDVDIVRKAIRVNLSDLAAMGAKPKFLLLGLCLNQVPNAKLLAKAIQKECRKFDIALIGGDTVLSSGPSTVSVTAIGELSKTAILRSGAVAGDDVWVSGTLGDGALGLKMLQSGQASTKFSALTKDETSFLASRYRWPEPRVVLGQELAKCAHGMIDISDGLAVDAAHIATGSQVQLNINLDQLPTSEAFKKWALEVADVDLHWAMLLGGDDYELLFTTSIAMRRRIQNIAKLTKCQLTRIGFVQSGTGVKFCNQGSDVIIPKTGFTHF